ncbi:5'-nucleotidase C-terminal domain-containing protein [Virgibacillus sediminis]|uniref:5'-nucleotidase C-terminal domain-containing protein n=1 Tax=Virgibacillus sediminis TaxID=202260 RepID=A0ABV7A390_9BACI
MDYFSRKKMMYLVLVCLVVLSNLSPAATVSAAGTEQEAGTAADELFISEYVEGSSHNKAIEIYNGTGSEVELSDYQLELYSNAAQSPNHSITLKGSLANGDVLVLAHSDADTAILDKADEIVSSVINFNGDDAVVLSKNGEALDVLGQVGVGETYGQEVTMTREPSVISPTSTYNPNEWAVHDEDTFDYLGSHTMDGMDPVSPPVDSGDNPEQDAEEYSIEETRELVDGTSVIVQGVVTADSSAISNGEQFTTYIQDETAGINLFSFEQGEIPDVTKGDLVKVTGKLDSYKGLKEIIPSELEVLEEGYDLPEVQQITLKDLQDPAIAENYEGELVEVNGFISNIPDSPAGGGYNVSMVDADFHGTTLRIMENSMDITAIEADKWYNVTGIVSQYDSYQLIPTGQEDIQTAQDQPEAPTAAGYYEATVASVTDGDTIRVEEPVFGETSVRFVNMDTPETYPSKNGDPDREEINENQKHFGDLATGYLNELIQPGDEIFLKVGDQPTDDYGRILAEVIRKDDDLNINLEMVKQGYASTYFIAPVDEEAYPAYQQAVKEAKEAGQGIWDPEEPLMELPFVFRANDDQKGFQRYVGNSETKMYVQPEDWEEVPVGNRIFFASPEEAESFGFAPVQDGTETDNLEVQLLGVNDLHGKIDQEYMLDVDGDGNRELYGRIDYTSAAMKAREEENEHTLMVHAGDMIGGSSPVSGLLQDEPTVEIMEEIGFDVGTVGNHEFDEGVDELLRMVNGGEHPEGSGTAGYDGMDFPVLCANCVDEESGDALLDAYHIEEVDGEKLGFIGVNTQETVNMVMPSSLEGVEFTDEAEAVNTAVDQLTAQGVEAIVVLAHMPAYQSGESATGEAAELANTVDDGVDVIFAAHNHQVNNAIVDNKLIVQASEYGKAFSDVDLEIDRETGDVVSKEAEVVFVSQSEYERDPAVTEILEKYAEEISPIINEVIGYNAEDLTGDYTNDGDHGLGNLIADGMKWKMDSDFAMMNGGGIRDDLLAGEVTWGDLYNIQPFGNVLMQVEVKGEDLYPILNEQISPKYGPDYSISGLHYTWNPELNEVVEITLPDGTPIDEEKVYTLTVNNYMGTSDGPIKELGKNPIMGPEDIDATVDYVDSLNSSEENPIVYGPEGRITETDKVPNESDENHEPAVEVAPRNDRGTAHLRTSELAVLGQGDKIVVPISQESRSRKLIVNKKQVDILRDKEVVLTVMNGKYSKTVNMADYEGNVLKVEWKK